MYHLPTGRLHVINGTAARVWELCDGTRSLSAIAAELGQAFSQPPLEATVRTEVGSFVAELVNATFLEVLP
ncbi:MAG: hypothetical protein A2284_06830 [Deltaproteobacteria bacterium RIFOXYA12_FULL_61_11]|nr:MAG: hypothetical protein A2284_06830 [Deltaproteobacteria bacterium RIFOXYA12_FULL_61_11]